MTMNDPTQNKHLHGNEPTHEKVPFPAIGGGDVPAELHDLGSGSAIAGTDATRVYVPGTQPPAECELVDIQPKPTRLGKYQIQVRIGRGGMGVVWKAIDPDLNRIVAIKVLSPDLAHSAVARRRFRREAQAVAAINHPNVLTIHSVEAEGETPFIVMEFISGESLREYVDRTGKLNSNEVLRLATQIAAGLAAAHANGVIHRDVKPGNVMLHEGATRLRLMDFGLARVAFDNVELTSHDHCVGTPAYMAPEQVRGEEVDARTDLFSLGGVMYFMMTGFSPFQGKSHVESIHRILNFEPSSLEVAFPGSSPVLSEIIDKLLKKRPSERYQSAQEVVDVLRSLLTQLNQAPTDHMVDVLNGKLRNTPQPLRVPTTSKPSRRGLLVIVAATLLVGSLLATKGFLMRPWIGMTARSNAAASNSHDVASGDAVTSKLTSSSATPPAVAVDPNVPKSEHLNVGPGGDCATIAEAIQLAAPNCTITVIGPATITESITIEGEGRNGLKLLADSRVVWRVPFIESLESQALLIRDVSNVEVSGFDFEVSTDKGRAINMTGVVGNVALRDCLMRHTALSKLSLVNVNCERATPESTLTLSGCRLAVAQGTGFCFAADAKEKASPRIVCRDSFFESNDRHLMVSRSCSHLVLSGNVFVGGHTALHFSFKPWLGDEQFLIHNNTFVGTRYWFSWMDSIPLATAVPMSGRSRVCNNLILGGERTLGKPEQWDASIGPWTFAANWWERDATTLPSADRGGRIAALHDQFDVPERSDSLSPSYLIPAAGSDLLTSGVGGDLPKHIGAKALLEDKAPM